MIKNISIFIIICTFNISLGAQNDSLIIYTKKTCSNCTYTKELLKNKGIPYKEHALEISKNGKQMLILLREQGYKDRIYLPVIFLNNNLLHPAIYKDTSLMRISLQEALDTIGILENTGIVNLIAYSNNPAPPMVADTNADEGSCEVENKPVYLICANFKEKEKAELFVNELKKSGYNNAGYLSYKKYYRVYCKPLDQYSNYNEELAKTRTDYQTSYILTIQ